MIRALCAVLLFIHINISFSKSVYDLNKEQNRVIPVHLKLGQVSVLRLDVKPQKILLGNPTHFDVQVYEQDIALRPKGTFSSNMFVYHKLGLISFKLFCDEDSENFNDVVHVQSKHTRIKKFKPSLRSLGKRLVVQFDQLKPSSKQGFYVLDFKLQNLKSRTIRTGKINVKFKRFGKNLKIKNQLKFSKKTLKKNQVIKGRLVFYLKAKKPLSLIFNFKSKHLSIIINRRSL